MPITKNNSHLTSRFLTLALQPEDGTTNRALLMAAITHRLAHDGVRMQKRQRPFPGLRPSGHFKFPDSATPKAG